MKLPLVPQLATKDGVSNKNARLTNTLKEVTPIGEFAGKRPALVEAAITSTQTTGNGLVCFDNVLVSVFDAHLCAGLREVGSAPPNGIITYALPVIASTYDIAYGNGKYVLACATMQGGQTRGVLHSTDLLNWTVVTFAVGFNPAAVTYFAGLYIVFDAQYGSSTNAYKTSPDLITWTDRTLPQTGTISDHIQYGGRLFIHLHYVDQTTGLCKLLYTTDGINWTTRSIAISDQSETYFFKTSYFVGFVGGGAYGMSYDGTTWVHAESFLGGDVLGARGVPGDTVQIIGDDGADELLSSSGADIGDEMEWSPWESTGMFWEEVSKGLEHNSNGLVNTFTVSWGTNQIFEFDEDGGWWTESSLSGEAGAVYRKIKNANGITFLLGEQIDALYALGEPAGGTHMEPAPLTDLTDSVYDFTQSPL